MKSVTLFALLALCSVALALRPLAPTSGSYTWEVVVDGDDSFIGGKSYFDYVAGYTREDSYDSAGNNPGIDQISIYDFRDNKATVTMIDKNGCTLMALTEDTTPAPYDWSSYTYTKTLFFNKHLAEQWSDPSDGSAAYFDVFTHDLIGLSSPATADEPAYIMNVIDYTDSAPDGSVFLFPDTIKCNSSNTFMAPRQNVIEKKLSINLKCSACKAAVKAIKCGVGKVAPVCPGLLKPVCAIAGKLLCESKLSPEGVCKNVRMC